MPAGRPRVHDREAISQELIEWAKKPDSINLCKFCCTREPPLDPAQLSQWAQQCDQFNKAYRTAKTFIGARREEMLNSETMHIRAYERNVRVYDHFVKEEDREMIKYEAETKKEQATQASIEDKSRFDDFIKTFSSIQKQDS